MHLSPSDSLLNMLESVVTSSQYDQTAKWLHLLPDASEEAETNQHWPSLSPNPIVFVDATSALFQTHVEKAKHLHS